MNKMMKKFFITTITIKLLLIMFMLILLVGTVSAFEFDNIKDVDYSDLSYNYPTITIRNSFLWIIPLDPIGKYQITDNTDICGGDCFTIGTAELYLDSELFSGSFYEDIITRKKKTITNSKWFFRKIVPNTFKEECLITIDNKTEESITTCNPIEIISQQNEWEEYVLGTILKAGNYEWNHTGSKGFYEGIDFIPQSNSVTMDEWVDWGAGGTVTYDGGYVVHTFLTSGSFNVTSTRDVDVLVIAGGGGGGGGVDQTAGGGGGGYQYNISFEVNAGNHTVTIGAGGAVDTNGGNSVFSTITATGGGAGGQGGDSGNGGGCGGGGGYGAIGGGGSQGGNGGTGQHVNQSNSRGAAGGGGASQNGGDFQPNPVSQSAPAYGGNGGNGTANSINGTSVYYAGGGGGGGLYDTWYTNAGIGGLGGGGDGGENAEVGEAGTNGLGGGGGGAGGTSGGGVGGSGIVIIKYALDLVITQSFPEDHFDTTNNIIDFGCNFTGQEGNNITNVSILVYNNSDNLAYSNSEANLNLISYNKTWLNIAFDDGIYKWACHANGTIMGKSTSNRTLTIDTIAPIINVTSPNAISNYGFIGQNISLNWSITEDNLQYCSFYYNNTNTTLNCTEGNYTFVLDRDNYNLTFFANDSFGHQVNEYFSWNYSLLLINESYVTPVLSGSVNSFRITFETFGNPITIVYLNYNGTNNLGSISSSENIYTLSRDIASLVVASAINSSFSWNITMQSGFTYLTTPQNQTITPIELTTNCTDRFYIYNFTLVDEITQARINETINGTSTNTSIKINLRLYNSDKTLNLVNFSTEFAKINPAAVCFGSNLTSGESYYLDTQIQYGAAGYSTELYNIENYLLDSTTLHQNVTLYDLETAKTTKFRLIARDSSYLPIEGGLIQIERKYIGNGTFLITEIPKTDERGITSASLQVEDAIYNFYIYKSGVLISSFTEVLAICQTPLVSECEIDFDDFQTEITIPNYEDGDDFNFTLEYNSTSDIVISQFLIPSGEPSIVQLVVIRDDALGTAVCADTITSSSGTLSCLIPASFGNATILATLYKDGVEQGMGNIRLNQSSSDIFGSILIGLSILVLITLIGMAVSDNPIVTAIFIFVGMVLLLSINLVESKGFIGATAVILFLAVAIIIFIIKASKRS